MNLKQITMGHSSATLLSFLFTLILGTTSCGEPGPGQASDLKPADILITGGTVITMDPERRCWRTRPWPSSVTGSPPLGPRPSSRPATRPEQVIDARQERGHARTHRRTRPCRPWTGEEPGHRHRRVVSGHGGSSTPRGSTEDFWRADALLTATERLRFGVTTGLTFFGGGDSVMRTDDPRYGDAYLQAIEDVGVRWFLAVGPRRPPFPTDLRPLGRRHAHRRPGDLRAAAGDYGRPSSTDGTARATAGSTSP